MVNLITLKLVLLYPFMRPFKARCFFDTTSIGHQDIRELCPALSLSSVEGALRKLVESGELRREGNGKNTHYYRTE